LFDLQKRLVITLQGNGNWKGLRVPVKLRVHDRHPTLRWCLCLCPGQQSIKEPARDGKKQKNIKHSGTITFDEIVNIA
jgi:large subunit ribosomal protein L12e